MPNNYQEFRQFLLSRLRLSLHAFLWWSDFNKSMMIQYTFCIKIFVLLLRYTGFLLRFSLSYSLLFLSDDYNNRLCFNISFSALFEIAKMFWGRRLTSSVAVQITGRFSQRFFNFLFNIQIKNWCSQVFIKGSEKFP